MRPVRIQINQLKAGVILSYLSAGMGLVISLLYTPVMLKVLGKSEYGVYTLAASVVSYLSLLSFGTSSAYVRYYSKYRVSGDATAIAKLNGMYLAFYAFIGVIALGAGTVVAMNAGLIFTAKLTTGEIAIIKPLIMILVVNIALSFPLSLFGSYISANERFFMQRLVQLARTLVNPFLMLAVLFLGYGSVGLVIVSVCLNLFTDVIYLIYCIKKLHFKAVWSGLDWPLFREIAIFSSFIFINLIVDQINWNIDKLFLAFFQGSVAIAVYGIGSLINNYYLQFSTMIANVFIPRVHKLISADGSKEAVTQLFTKVGRLQFVVLALIASGFVFFGQPFIWKWCGPGYEDAYGIVLLLILPVTVPLIQNLGIEIQRAMNLHKFRSLLYLFIAILNACISIPLCKFYGGIGCALGTGISLLLGNGLIMNFYYHKKCGIDILYFWKQVLHFLPAFLPVTVVGLLLIRFVDLSNTLGLIGAICAYALVYCGAMWLWGLNEYEKGLIQRPLRRVMKGRNHND